MNYLNETENISDDTQVDNLISGSNTVGEVEILKQKCEELFRKGGFNLHYRYFKIPSIYSELCDKKIPQDAEASQKAICEICERQTEFKKINTKFSHTK